MDLFIMNKYDIFIGRWLFFHKGHLSIIEKVFKKNGRPILLLIMDTDEEPLVSYRIEKIIPVLNKRNIPHKIIIIPPIASVNWGRTVGYETNYIEVDDDIKAISSTKIKEKIKNNDSSWQKDIP